MQDGIARRTDKRVKPEPEVAAEGFATDWGELTDADLAPAGADPRELTKWDLRKQKTRQLILHAAREVFAARGFNAPRVEDVARAAGISRAAFYLHFKSPEELIEVLFEREVRWQLRRYSSLTWELLCNKRRLRGWLERFYASFRQERQYYLIIQRGLSANPAYLRIIMAERIRVLEALARRVPELGLLQPDRSRDRTRMIEMCALTSRLEDLSLYSAFNAWDSDFDLAVDLLVEALMSFASASRSARTLP